MWTCNKWNACRESVSGTEHNTAMLIITMSSLALHCRQRIFINTTMTRRCISPYFCMPRSHLSFSERAGSGLASRIPHHALHGAVLYSLWASIAVQGFFGLFVWGFSFGFVCLLAFLPCRVRLQLLLWLVTD